MIRWLINLWYERQRSVDLRVLWPVCKEQAGDLDYAKTAFALHAFNDRAWLCLGPDEVIRRIDQLT